MEDTSKKRIDVSTIVLTGVVVRDPEEARDIGDDAKVVTLRLACNPTSNDKTTYFIDVDCWRANADACSHLSKGDFVLIEGVLIGDNYSKDGKTVYKNKVTARKLKFLRVKKWEDEREEVKVQKEPEPKRQEIQATTKKTVTVQPKPVAGKKPLPKKEDFEEESSLEDIELPF